MKRLTLLILSLWAAVASSQSMTVGPCYWSGQLTKCFPSTGLYLDTQRTLRLGDSTTNYVELQAPAAVTTYTLTMPPSQGAVSTFLGNNGSGSLSWGVPAASIGGVITGAHAGDVIFATPAGVFAQDDNFTDQSGNIVIGTTTPRARLTIEDSTSQAVLMLRTGQTFNPLRIFSTGGGLLFDINTAGSVVSTPLVATTNGTAGSPNFTENSLFRSGMFLPSSDVVAFSTHGSERMRILDSPGNVAIGTTTAASLLTVGTAGGFQVATTGAVTAASLSLAAALPVASGGTGLASGTSGGILGYTASGTLASSALLTLNGVVIGGGSGATPTATAADGTTTDILHGGSPPTFGAMVAADLPSGPAINGVWNASGGGILVPDTPASPTTGTAQNGNVYSGTFTPSITNTTNIASSSVPAAWLYTRIGHIVNYAGVLTLTASANGGCTFNLSVPIASSFSATSDGIFTCTLVNSNALGGGMTATSSAGTLTGGIVINTSGLNYNCVGNYRIR